MDPMDPCPSGEEILRWSAGHYTGSERDLIIGAHVARCLGPCSEYLDVAHMVMTDVTEAMSGDVPEESSQDTENLARVLEVSKRMDRSTADIFDAPSSGWGSQLALAEDRQNLHFLYRVADRAVYLADEKPEEIKSFVEERLIPLVLTVADDPDRARVLALAGLAVGIALRTLGDHIGALAAYEQGHRALGPETVAEEHHRLELARGASLRRLKRYDEARAVLKLALRGFRTWGIEGQGRALWQLSNVASEMGDSRQAFHLAWAARRQLLSEGNTLEATVMLQTAAVALMNLGRRAPARRLLAALQGDVTIQSNPYQRARLFWNRAQLATLDDEPERATDLLGRAAEAFSDAGAVLDAAGALLDLAAVHGATGDHAAQANAASRAAAILSHVPGQEPELAVAMAELLDALRTGAAIEQATHRVRELLRRR